MVHISVVNSIALLLTLVSNLQPGYLRKLLPDSAPTQPETLQDVLDGEILNQLLMHFINVDVRA